LKDVTDNAIIDLFLERDEAAIQRCDEQYGAHLRRFGNRITADSDTTEECVDDTYMKAWQAIPPSEPRGFLFEFLSKILRQRCLDRIRSDGRIKRGAVLTVLIDELDEVTPTEGKTDDKVLLDELSKLISDFLRKLKDEQRHIFVLRYFYAMQIEEISRKLGVGEGKIKSALKRARDKLKLYLEIYGYKA
jgi:RNA polymerase sigma-70 factor (ECF subfamily)